jgi:hypothetical protein
MAGTDALHEALTELFAVANSAMTRAQRIQRAAPVLPTAGFSLGDVVAAVRREDLPWNADRAKALGVDTATWQQALTVAGLDDVRDVGGLLDMMHRAEAAAAMLRAGYRPERDAAGRLRWAS